MSVTDREVAVEVMGWAPVTMTAAGREEWLSPDGGSRWWALPLFTQDVPDAMQVVAQMERYGWRWSAAGGKWGYSFTFYRDDKSEDAWKLTRSRVADTLPQAICEAAVAAKRAEREAQ